MFGKWVAAEKQQDLSYVQVYINETLFGKTVSVYPHARMLLRNYLRISIRLLHYQATTSKHKALDTPLGVRRPKRRASNISHNTNTILLFM
jgi:hypothetical protein